jgi:2'-5' RNA ligase
MGSGTGASDGADRVTIGVSIAIPEPYGSSLQDVRDGYGDPLARAIPTHVTLLGPTSVRGTALSAIEQHLERVAAGAVPYPMTLSGTGTFRPISPVVFVRIAKGGEECGRLEQQVRSGPLEAELRFPYHPHVTIGHDLPAEVLDRAEAELADFRADFEVTEFSLYLHGADGVWRPQWRFVLGCGVPRV